MVNTKRYTVAAALSDNEIYQVSDLEYLSECVTEKLRHQINNLVGVVSVPELAVDQLPGGVSQISVSFLVYPGKPYYASLDDSWTKDNSKLLNKYLQEKINIKGEKNVGE